VPDADVKDRRSHPRTEVSWPVRLWLGDTMLVGRAVDVSEQGLCVITAPTGDIKRGSCYRIDVVVGADHQFSCQGEVRHVTASLVGLRTIERLKLTD
jgi:PilZ domain-containing protein